MAIDMLIGTSAGTGLQKAATPVLGGAAAPIDGGSFTESLGKLLEGVEKSEADSNKAVAGMVDKSTEVHDAMIAMQRAEMALQLTVQVRNKLVQAYQEIMRMSI